VQTLPYSSEVSASLASPEGYTGATACSYIYSELNTMWWYVGPNDNPICLSAKAKANNGEYVILAIYSGGDCSNLLCTGQSNSSPSYSSVSWSANAGEGYYVAVALQQGFSSSAITLEIEVSLQPNNA
jgi:hypothetical protein